ncbi:family 43 glycosylhydrolase [Cellulomonas sp. McL0617]|uniref:glycoside hydrolase family 43 protein n=1 Tax=Cellulomonas sp. McL0617 TaxID=3415675 RepID=UPI003CEEF55B
MTYQNPVIKGTAPDPSAVRVGEDYYLASSTFDLLPGITIRHSTDLVTWRIVGHAVSRPAQYRRDGEPGPVVLFAPTLRHHDGVFYLACTNAVGGQGNFVLRTTDVTGEWSDALWIDSDGFDPSLFRDDDGTWYYTRRNLQFRPDGNLGPIVQATIDLATGVLGEMRDITPPHGFASNDIEGPHLFARDGWYYLSSAEGGSWAGHMQTIARSRSPWGPFEAAPTTPWLTHRHLVANRVQNLGHAELVEATDGSWWALALGTRHPRMARHHNLGRETFLTPVRWVDGWPVAGERGDGTTSLVVDADPPVRGRGIDHVVADTLWTRGWKTIGAAPARLDPLDTDARIELPCGPDPRTRPVGACGALLRAQTEDDQRFSATVANVPAGAVAGIAAFTDASHVASLTVEKVDGGRVAVLTRTVDDVTSRTHVPLPAAGEVGLRIDGHETSYAFVAVTDGSETVVGHCSARLLSAETAQWFVGVHWALLAVGDDGSTTFADVQITDLAPGAPASPVPF